MKYIKFFENIKKEKESDFSIKNSSSVEFGKGLKKDELKKFKILAKYFDIDSVSGHVDSSNYDLDFGKAIKNNRGKTTGMLVLFNINGDILNNKCYGNIIFSYNYETKQLDIEGDGENLSFDFDYYANKNIAQFETNVERLKEWVDNPENYEIFKNAEKYNL